MDYKVLKAINNNTVLVKDSQTQEQLILMSKGIGFNRKINDKVSDISGDNQIFKLWNSSEPINTIKYDNEKLKNAVEEIAKIAEEKLGLKKEKIINPLLDHIAFLIDRINFGIYTENPFQNEISILYAKEYEVSKIAVDLIKKRTGLDVGESEIGLITLHLNSAVRKKPVSASLETVRVYNNISNLICNELANEVSSDFIDVRIFLMALDKLVKAIKSGTHLNLNINDTISSSMNFSYNISVKIAEILSKEMDINLNCSDISFITIDIERLRQLKILRG